MTTFSARLTNRTFSLPQSHDYSCICKQKNNGSSTVVTAETPDLPAHDSANTPDMRQ